MGRYDTALICLNGHISNQGIHTYPQDNGDYCTICGSKNIQTCSNCNAPIKGCFIGDAEAFEFGESLDSAPSFCYKCGNPYPWTEEKVKALKEALELSSITDSEKEEFGKNLNDIIADTPRSNVAALKIKMIGSKVGKEVWSVVRDILVDIASETAKKTIGL